MRFLFITSDFPNIYDPHKGVFNLYLTQALARRHEVKVVCPVSWIDRWKAGRKAEQAEVANFGGVEVQYPTFFYPPKLWRSKYHRFLWRSIRKTVWRVLGS